MSLHSFGFCAFMGVVGGTFVGAWLTL
jgi:hypothetical protein